MKRSSLTAATIALFLGAAMFDAAAHEGEHFSAGEPGNPKKPARVVQAVSYTHLTLPTNREV